MAISVINWTNETLEGLPSYNIEGENTVFEAAAFKLSNGRLAEGTKADSDNMKKLVQRAEYKKSFYYNGSETPVYNFPNPSPDFTASGVILTFVSKGQQLFMSGRTQIYLVNKDISRQLFFEGYYNNSDGDYLVCGRKGEVISGFVTNERF